MELRPQAEKLAEIKARAAVGPVTLLYAARDAEHCNAEALSRLLAE